MAKNDEGRGATLPCADPAYRKLGYLKADAEFKANKREIKKLKNKVKKLKEKVSGTIKDMANNDHIKNN